MFVPIYDKIVIPIDKQVSASPIVTLSKGVIVRSIRNLYEFWKRQLLARILSQQSGQEV